MQIVIHNLDNNPVSLKPLQWAKHCLGIQNHRNELFVLKTEILSKLLQTSKLIMLHIIRNLGMYNPINHYK